MYAEGSAEGPRSHHPEKLVSWAEKANCFFFFFNYYLCLKKKKKDSFLKKLLMYAIYNQLYPLHVYRLF